jgi:hypothetical protein
MKAFTPTSKVIEEVTGEFHTRALHTLARTARFFNEKGDKVIDKEIAGRLQVVRTYLALSRHALLQLDQSADLFCDECGEEATHWICEKKEKKDIPSFLCDEHALSTQSKAHHQTHLLTRIEEKKDYERMLYLSKQIREEHPEDSIKPTSRRDYFPISLVGLTRSLFYQARKEAAIVNRALYEKGDEGHEIAHSLDIVDDYLEVAHALIQTSAIYGRFACRNEECQEKVEFWNHYRDRDSDYIELFCPFHAEEAMSYHHSSTYRWPGMRPFTGGEKHDF